MANADQPLWKRFQFGRELNARRPGAVTALDVDGQLLRVVQTAPRGQGTVVTRVAVGELQFASGVDRTDPSVIGQAVAATLEILKVKPAQVVLGVPRHLVILRTLSLPLIEDVRELASMVHMQIGKDLPFRLEEAVIDFKVREQVVRAEAEEGNTRRAAPTQKDASAAAAAGRVEVLVAALRKETVDFYQRLAQAAKLKLVALGWLSQANARSLEACQVVAGKDAVALVSLRPEEVGIDIISEQSLLFSRGAPILANATAPTEPPLLAPAPASATPAPASARTPESYAEAVTIEVIRSLHSYGGMESSLPVVKLLVTGATGREALVLATLRDRLKIVCDLLDPGEVMELPEGAQADAQDALGALGLGLGVNDPEGLPFDFLNPKRPAVPRNMRRIWTLAGTAAGAALLIGLLGFRSHLINQRLKVTLEIQAELTKAEKNLPAYRKMQQQAATLQTWSKEGRDWLEQYAYLSAVLPGSEDLYITSLSVSGQGNIHLAVQARSGEILANLDRQLRAAGYEVKPLAITPGSEKHGYNFRSTVELIVPAKMKIDLSKVQPPARPADDGSLEGKSKPARKGGNS